MFDAHCDTLLKIAHGGSLYKNEFDVSFEKLATYGKAVQLFAVFNEGNLCVNDILRMIDLLKSECEKSDLAKFCITADNIECNERPVSALISLEGVGNTPDFLCDDLKKFYIAGVRIASITWNGDNKFCGGIGDNKKGLTADGIKLLEYMAKLDMVLDVSHISDVGFWGVAEIENLNIIATHSNSREICNHNRNLTDEQFLQIIRNGGVVGMNTYPLFLTDTKKANVYDLIRHIEHFCSLGGEKNICLGADFDGIEIHMNDIDSCEKMNILSNELAKMNYTNLQIEGFLCENLMNFYRKMNF